MKHWVLSISVCVICYFSPSATASDENKAIEWFNKNATNAASFEFPNEFYLEIVEHYPSYLSAQEADSIEKQISASGSGVSGSLIQRREIINAGGREVRYRLWYQDESHWRLTKDTVPPNPVSPYEDAGRHGNTLWNLSSLVLHETDIASLDNYDNSVDPNSMKNDCLYTLYRSIFAISSPPTKYYPEPPVRTDSTNGFLTLHSSHSNENVDFVKFQLQSMSNYFVIREMTIVRNESAKIITAGIKTLFADWAYSSVIDHDIALTRTMYDGNRVYCTYTIAEFESFSDPEFIDELTLLPSYKRQDPIRGDLTYTVLMNYPDNERLDFSRARRPDDINDEDRSAISKLRIRETALEKSQLNKIGLSFVVCTILLVIGITVRKMKGTSI